MKRIIKEIAVLGSGVMGSRIAAHFANIGCKVYLLDIVPKELNDGEKKNGLSLSDKKVRNRIVNDNLKNVLNANPSPVYISSFSSRIVTGNFEDDFNILKNVDWIIEAVVENLEIKRAIFDKIENYRKPGTLISSNTSGIPIHLMAKGRSDDFQKNFCGTHFFNPPRYIQLLEIIPSPKTGKEIIDFLLYYGKNYLGKTTVLCKDTPAFIANRIGVFSMMAVFKLMKEFELSITEVDLLTGPLTGKPKSATFRTCDMVGIDTLANVANNIYKDCPYDEMRELFTVPDYVNKLAEKKWLGDKTGQGFYKKNKNAQGETEILEIDLNTFEYKPSEKPKFSSVAAAKLIENLGDRLKALYKEMDQAGFFLRMLYFYIFSYSSRRIPEITDEIYKIDDAIKSGFGWELGPFETWDLLGFEKISKQMEEVNILPAAWIKEMLAKGFKSFYQIEKGKRKYFDKNTFSYKEVPGKSGFIILDNYRANKPLWQNSGAILHDIGEGVLNLEFQTKMNSIGSEILEGINKSIEIAEKDFEGLVIANNGQNFSAGANLATMFMLAAEQEFDEIDMAIRNFQSATMRIRYSSIPVVAAPHALALGGGCEICLHADKVQASAETYIGLVEVGVGIIPAGGGSKEMTLRASDSYAEGALEFQELQKRYMNIAQAKVSTSGYEAFDMDILKKGRDEITVNPNKVIYDAKQSVLKLVENGYTQPCPRNNIKVLGKEALATLLIGAYSYRKANYISEHDKKIAEKLAYIMSGGDLSQGTLVSEQYLLDLEREAFLSLIGEKKTLERIQSILNMGKMLRN
jgi:3-hydroxyacyl-CoA dehydrogenase